MQILQSQMDAIGARISARYLHDLAAFFRKNCTALVVRFNDAALLARLAEIDEASDPFGFATDKGRIAFIGLALAAGRSFPNDPKVVAFLSAPGTDPDANVEWLFRDVFGRLSASVSVAARR